MPTRTRQALISGRRKEARKRASLEKGMAGMLLLVFWTM